MDAKDYLSGVYLDTHKFSKEEAIALMEDYCDYKKKYEKQIIEKTVKDSAENYFCTLEKSYSTFMNKPEFFKAKQIKKAFIAGAELVAGKFVFPKKDTLEENNASVCNSFKKEEIKNKIFATQPIAYEIEILEITRDIPARQEKNFINWLLAQANIHGTGKHHEHYAFTNFYQDDIGVTFTVKTKN